MNPAFFLAGMLCGAVLVLLVLSPRAERYIGMSLLAFLGQCARDYNHTQAALDAQFKWKMKKLIAEMEEVVDFDNRDGHGRMDETCVANCIIFAKQAIRLRNQDNDTIPNP